MWSRLSGRRCGVRINSQGPVQALDFILNMVRSHLKILSKKNDMIGFIL